MFQDVSSLSMIVQHIHPSCNHKPKNWLTYTVFMWITITNQVLFYWWLPDATFAALDPKLLLLPEHDPSEWAVGNHRTATAGGYIGTLVSWGLRRKSPVVIGLLESFRMASLSGMQEMLLKLAQGETLRQVACGWLLSNRETWTEWIPRNRKTSCPPGTGMMNLQGEFVGSRESAVDCGFCPPGTFSESTTDVIGTSHRCALCESGKYQNFYAEGACKECELGQFSATNGSVACERCSLGSYANSTGLTACTKCGDESQWTTSQVVMDKGLSKWIELEGATSSDFCGCRAGWFLFHGSCQSCIEGSTCPGSSQLELLPGHGTYGTYGTRMEPEWTLRVMFCCCVNQCQPWESGIISPSRPGFHYNIYNLMTVFRWIQDNSSRHLKTI